MKKFLYVFLFILIAGQILAQYDLKEKLRGYTNPEEIVSLSETLPFNQAVEVLSKVSEKIAGKRIVSTVPISTPIGVEIDKMPYKKALFVIVQYNNLVVEETQTTVIIKSKEDTKATLSKDIYASVGEREVKISAIIFEANTNEMQEKGVNWQLLLSKTGISVGSNLVTLQQNTSTNSSSTSGTSAAATQNPPDYTLSPKINFTLGKDVDGTAEGMFRFFETEKLGKILTRPTISVTNGQQGKTQVGSDFSIKERDFAGNLIDKFYQSGTIIEVTPHIYNEEGIDYIFLNVRIEKSTVVIGSLSVEKPKTEVSTKVLLRNGEETVIGGLLTNEETIERRGVPFLKDLPWWVLGLKYLFGYDQVTTSTKEIITLLKVELLPTLKERLEVKKKEALKDERNELHKNLENYQNQIKNSEVKKQEEK